MYLYATCKTKVPYLAHEHAHNPRNKVRQVDWHVHGTPRYAPPTLTRNTRTHEQRHRETAAYGSRDACIAAAAVHAKRRGQQAAII
jgi:hypothetical protein